jgi:mannose-1-phosphate guanylyltransferase/mannose-6-phosphate isomerase
MSDENKLLPVILSGGTGTRLWPLSRSLYPKQFISLTGEQTLLQQTVKRLDGLIGAPPLVVCNEDHRFMVAEQMRALGLGDCSVLLEPVGRNTAPAVAVGALEALATHPDALLLVLPADHVFKDVAAFQEAVRAGVPHAEAGNLVTFGIKPDRPETGYGYIKADGPGVSPVARFVEKPDMKTAEGYVAAGDYYWNSGMFLFGARRYLDELEKFSPELAEASRAAHEAITRDADFLRLGKASFEACPSDSIDYAVMERTDSAMVVPLSAGWNDVGSWTSLWDIGDKSPDGNVVWGDVWVNDVQNSYLRAEHRLLAAVGVEDHVVVETADAVLVAHKDRTQEIKQIVDELKLAERPEVVLHKKVYRPWGSVEALDAGERFQAKRITLNPHARLSKQMHHHRAEHWIVVRGTAKVTRDGEAFILTENESTFIPVAIPHRLENPGTIPLQMIEIRSGSYLEEDDIVRFDDQGGDPH